MDVSVDLPRIALAELAFFSGQALGKGGYGDVWAGVWIRDKVRQVAVKRLREAIGSQTLRDLVEEEVGQVERIRRLIIFETVNLTRRHQMSSVGSSLDAGEFHGAPLDILD